MQKITGTLGEFGLDGPEIQIYLSLLQIGEAPASLIAKQAGLKRGHTYNILNELAQKGIATHIIKNRIHYFSVCDPEDLVNILERRKPFGNTAEPSKHQKSTHSQAKSEIFRGRKWDPRNV